MRIGEFNELRELVSREKADVITDYENDRVFGPPNDGLRISIIENQLDPALLERGGGTRERVTQ